MWAFCLRSLVREYGWRFVRRVALRHPVRTLQALQRAGRLDVSGVGVDVTGGGGRHALDRPLSIVGAGFCLKPTNPSCPSGRANHDCEFLERLAGADAAGVPAPCRPCAIRDIGTRALRAGAAFYVMTSARDILDDVFVPAMTRGTFTTGLFVLCRYSFQPFAIGLLASGISGRLFPLEAGDCRDYRTWLLADRGIKAEQTAADGERMGAIARLFDAAASPSGGVRVQRRGSVLCPLPSAPASTRTVEAM